MRGSNASIASAGEEYQQAIRYRPHKEVDTAVFGVPMPWYRQMIAAESPLDDHWHGPDTIAVRNVPQNTAIPMLMIGGWYDVFFGPQFEDWQRLASQANSRYIIGPYTHSGTTGELDPPGAEGGRFQWKQMLPWLEHHLRGKPLTLPTGLSIYVMGDGAWQERKQWPTAVEERVLHLSNLEAANTCDGGELGEAPGHGVASFTYDPDDPVPTRGGAGMLAFNLPG
jgi:putative CocE/NonD family hydrolase